MQRDVAGVIELLNLYRSADAALAAVAPEALAKIREIAETIDLDYTLSSLTETLGRSREGLKRIQQIVKDLREFSRQEAVGDWQQGADLVPGIQSTLNIVRGRARAAKVDLEIDIAPLPGVTCCPPKINQVVMNLLTNAIDACLADSGEAAAEGATVTLRARPSEGGVMIQVQDTGSGIEPAIRDKIFDPFFTTKAQGKGTGLGLSISHGIIAEHGGRIEVGSTPGKGTCFTIYLPVIPLPKSK